jgi:hypothetical protein
LPNLAPLAWTRAGIGALILLRTTPLLTPLSLWFVPDTGPLLGWPAGAAIREAALPPAMVAGLCLLRTAAALALMLGVRSEVAGIVAGVSGYVVMAQDPFSYAFTLHLLYQAAFLLALVDSATTFALRPRPACAPQTSIWLMRAWVASIYGWAGISKLRRDWVDGRTLALLHDEGTLRGPIADWLLASVGSRAAVGTMVVVAELALGPLLLWPRTRKVGVAAAFAFHAGLEVTAHPDLLGWGMMVLLLAYLEPAAASTGSQRIASAG